MSELKASVIADTQKCGRLAVKIANAAVNLVEARQALVCADTDAQAQLALAEMNHAYLQICKRATVLIRLRRKVDDDLKEFDGE